MRRIVYYITLLVLIFVGGDGLLTQWSVRADAVPNTAELIYTALQNTTSPAQSATISNNGAGTIDITNVQIVGTNPTAFTLTNPPPGNITLTSGANTAFNVTFNPPAGANGVHLSAILRVTTTDPITPTVDIGLHGLSLQGLEGTNEPGLQAVVDTLGYTINIGNNNLISRPLPENLTPIGDEVNIQLFQRANPGPVSMVAVARFSPDEALPYGYYFPDGTNAPGLIGVNQMQNTAVNLLNHQTLNPIVQTGVTTFDPGTFHFGFYVTSISFGRSSYTQDSLNTGPRVRAARSFIVRDRTGNLIPNTYLLTYEDANNGDYQDYVFLISNVTAAVTEPPVAVDDAAITPQDTPITIDLTNNDLGVDAPLNPAMVTLTTQPVAAEGTVINNADGTVLFAPALAYNGTATFNYTVQDTLGQTSASALVTVQVDPLVAPPPPPVNPPPAGQSAAPSNPAPGAQAPVIVAVAPSGPVFNISHSAAPGVAAPGDAVTFTIILQNLGSQAINILNLEDILPDVLEILNADASSGTVRLNGQQVIFSTSTLPPGGSVTITVQARIRVGTNMPIMVSQACAGAENLAATCAQASVLGVTRLPTTGETPLWRTLAIQGLALLGGLVLSAGMLSFYRVRRSVSPFTN